MNKLFVFDLDDTLIDNVHDYADPILDSCRLIVRTLGNKAPHVSKIVAMEQEIDKARIKEVNPDTGQPYLFSIERFPGSLVQTYLNICKHSGATPLSSIEMQLHDIGMQAFDKKRYLTNVNPHARAALSFLRDKGDHLVLCTKGDGKVQAKKVAALRKSGVDINCFDELLIVDNKDTQLFTAMKSGFGKDSAYSVGNSYQSDILPALNAGYMGIYIPVETWESLGQMDELLAKVDKTKVLVLPTLEDLPKHYGELA
ncbi:MAG: hypothetical protein Q7S36_03320 [Candidatus Liptonbacteria bacterium]|nr:hypothetical protein [Candidatus Liptonbacteria bacterium]